MAQIKNFHLLDDLPEQQKSKMEYAAVQHSRMNNLSFKIVEVDPKSITIQVVQGKNAARAYHPQKRLIEIVHETFDRFFPNKKIRVHAVPFIESPANDVDADWINAQMLSAGIRLKEIAADTGVDYTQLSSLVSGARPLSQPMKALFYFYFLARQRQAA